MTPEELALAWWDAFNQKDFAKAESLFAPDCIIDWPVSNERMTSPKAWREIKEYFSSEKPWKASIVDIIVNDRDVVTFTHVSDGEIQNFAITRFEIENGKILRQSEYWPAYTPPGPSWRKPWIKPIPAGENPMQPA